MEGNSTKNLTSILQNYQGHARQEHTDNCYRLREPCQLNAVWELDWILKQTKTLVKKTDRLGL